jgi:hypothetical protein
MKERKRGAKLPQIAQVLGIYLGGILVPLFMLDLLGFVPAPDAEPVPGFVPEILEPCVLQEQMVEAVGIEHRAIHLV